MKYWLMKSEPAVYPWSQLVREKRTSWNGVRNYQANNNMKAMAIDDQAFFYHSNDDRAIVGIMKIIKLWHLDPEDPTGKFGMVDVAPVKPVKNHVSLTTIKNDPALQDIRFVKQGRLSVSPITVSEWKRVVALSEINPGS